MTNDGSSKQIVSKFTGISKPNIHGATAGPPSVEDNLENLHICDTVSKKGKVDDNVGQLNTEATANVTAQSDGETNSSYKTKVNLTSECNPSSMSNDKKLQPPIGHQMDTNGRVINDGSKLSVGPKHYGAPVQKLLPREQVMAALLQWKTPETVRFLGGFLPDYNKNDGDDEVSNEIFNFLGVKICFW